MNMDDYRSLEPRDRVYADLLVELIKAIKKLGLEG